MKRRGHPVRGGIFGLLLGIVVAFDLSLFHVSAFTTLTIIVLPVVLMILGIVLGLLAPIKRRPPGGSAEPSN